jgi:hypothetical protein
VTRWNPVIVMEQIVEKCIVAFHPPKTLIIGMDGKYFSILQRMLPPFVSETFLLHVIYRLRSEPECIKELRRKKNLKWF